MIHLTAWEQGLFAASANAKRCTNVPCQTFTSFLHAMFAFMCKTGLTSVIQPSLPEYYAGNADDLHVCAYKRYTIHMLNDCLEKLRCKRAKKLLHLYQKGGFKRSLFTD